MTEIIVETYKLNDYAQRLSSVNAKARYLECRLQALYRRTGLLDLQNLIRREPLAGYCWRILRSRDYLMQTSSEFESLEREINCENFDIIHRKATEVDSDSSAIVGKLSQLPIHIFGPRILDEILTDGELLKKIFENYMQEAKTAGQVLGWLEELYEKVPREVEGIVNVLIPSSLKKAYAFTSDLLQGEATVESVWDLGKYIVKKNAYVSAVFEAVEYAFDKGAVRDAEMQAELLAQIKELDLAGAVIDAAEGFTDTILAGSVECLFDIAGNSLDALIGDISDIPYVGRGIKEATKYITGMLSPDGEEYSLGELVGKAGEFVSDAIDFTTDLITDATDVVTSAITSGAKSVCSWLGGLFA